MKFIYSIALGAMATGLLCVIIMCVYVAGAVKRALEEERNENQ